MVERALLLALAFAVLAESALLVTMLDRARRQRRGPDVFRCRTRRPDPRDRGAETYGRSRLGWASWAHGVLLLHVGHLGRVDAFPVRFPEGTVRRISRETAKGLGPAPVMVLLRLDDGGLVELAARREARELVAGPFLAACVLTPDR
jgi:hypothetical protein